MIAVRSLPLAVRAARPEDEAEILALLRDLELDYPGRDLRRFTVGDLDGRVVAIAELKRIGGVQVLSCVGVRRELQGTGLGRELVAEMLRGVEEDVVLFTLIPGFFEKLGFVEARSLPSAFPARVAIYGCEGCEPSRCRCLVRRAERPTSRPSSDAFEPLRLDNRSVVAEHLARSQRPTCDLSIASLLIWRECEAPWFTFINGNLCILIEPHSEPSYFLEPLGDGDLVATVEACLRKAGRVSRARAEVARRLPEDRFEIRPVRDHFDYVYELQELVELRGKKYDSKRNQISRFTRHYSSYDVVPLGAAHREDALDLFDRWAREREAGNEACQRRAFELAFESFDPLGLRGTALFVAGRMEGVLLASASPCPTTAIVHFLYANPQVPGIHQTLLWESCRRLKETFTRVNLEEDLGIPSLRKAKLSYRPAHLEEKVEITFR